MINMSLIISWTFLFHYFAVGLAKAQSQLPETRITSNSECFGSDNLVTCTCGGGSTILVGDVFVGSKLVTDGCPSTWNVTANDDNTTCCETSADDCVFTVGTARRRSIANLCNGRAEYCDVGVVNDVITEMTCNGTDTSTFMPNTNYMFMEYYCIDDDRIFATGDAPVTVTRENTTIYAVNARSPLLAMAENRTSFSVETSHPNATLEVFKVFIDIPCGMSIYLEDRAGTVVSNWTCADNSFTMETVKVTSDKVKVVIQSNISLEDGHFWLGFKAPMNSSITLVYPDVENTTDCGTTIRCMSTDNSNLTRNIVLAVCLGFIVIFGVLVTAILCVMKNRQRREKVKVERTTSMDSDNFVMKSTEYKRVTVQSAILDQTTVEITPSVTTIPEVVNDAVVVDESGYYNILDNPRPVTMVSQLNEDQDK